MIPLAPSTKIFLASAAVGATSATRFAAPAVTFSRTNSANARVFPKPRPASSNQMNQSSPGGCRWLGRATIGQLSNSSSSIVKSVRFNIDIENLGNQYVQPFSPLSPAKHAGLGAPARKHAWMTPVRGYCDGCVQKNRA
jgi:hypothetical protein